MYGLDSSNCTSSLSTIVSGGISISTGLGLPFFKLSKASDTAPGISWGLNTLF